MTDRMPDLSPDRAAALVDAALERQYAARLREATGPTRDALPVVAQPFADALLAEIARLSARVAALEDAQAAAARSREERLRLDPLRFIPEARRIAAMGPEPEPEAGPFLLDAGDPDFRGFGWWEAERTQDGALRWSGAARCASLLLPALGGGDLVLTLCVRAPFGTPLDIAGQDIFLDGQPLAFSAVSSTGVVGIFEAPVTLPPMPAGSRVTLLLHGPQHEDPDPGPRRDTRRIGLGLVWARLRRA